MSGTLFLIVEGKKDEIIVRSFLRHHFPQLRVICLMPTHPNISRLAAQIDELFRTALAKCRRNDCIAVLHDLDQLSRPTGRQDYDQIETFCRVHNTELTHILAVDEIESWLLADSGLSHWLQQNTRNFDNQQQPSKILERWLDSNPGRLKYNIMSLERSIIRNLSFDGDHRSPSLKDALGHLENAPCIRN